MHPHFSAHMLTHVHTHTYITQRNGCCHCNLKLNYSSWLTMWCNTYKVQQRGSEKTCPQLVSASSALNRPTVRWSWHCETTEQVLFLLCASFFPKDYGIASYIASGAAEIQEPQPLLPPRALLHPQVSTLSVSPFVKGWRAYSHGHKPYCSIKPQSINELTYYERNRKTNKPTPFSSFLPLVSHQIL